MSQQTTASKKLSYGALGLALGFIGLPLYVYLPKYYAENFGIPLIYLSALFFATRVIDFIQDPLISWFSDKVITKSLTRQKLLIFCGPFLAVSFLALLFPQDLFGIEIWMVISLIATYTFFSFLSINYHTMAAEIYEDYNQQTSLVSFREALVLVGIALGSILPSALLNQTSVPITHAITWGIFLVLLGAGLYFTTQKSPDSVYHKTASENLLASLKTVLKNKKYLSLSLVFFLSNVAAALPATLVLFYIEDVLEGQAYYGLFLMIYFLCALGGLPFWYKVSEYSSKRAAWMAGMICTILGFMGATFLGPQDFIAYGGVCVLTGFCLGADLTMPASLLSDLITKTTNKAKYYGLWGLLSKSSLAIAGSLGLLVLGLLDYQPGTEVTPTTRWHLSLSYALIPCLIKVTSLIGLYFSPLDRRE